MLRKINTRDTTISLYAILYFLTNMLRNELYLHFTINSIHTTNITFTYLSISFLNNTRVIFLKKKYTKRKYRTYLIRLYLSSDAGTHTYTSALDHTYTSALILPLVQFWCCFPRACSAYVRWISMQCSEELLLSASRTSCWNVTMSYYTELSVFRISLPKITSWYIVIYYILPPSSFRDRWMMPKVL